MNWLCRFGFSILILLLLSTNAFAEITQVSKVRIGVHKNKTRFVLEISRPISYRIFLLDKPYRVVIDLQDIHWRAPVPKKMKGTGYIAKFRFGLFRPGNSRVVVDLTRPVKVARHTILKGLPGKPNRFFIDLVPIRSDEFLSAKSNIISSNWPLSKNTKFNNQVRVVANNSKDGRHVIMIDPGHGGVDPGAVGSRGTFESKITLEVAHTLKRILKKSQKYIPKLTRDREIFVPLRDRFNQAETVGAQLFISLHADAISNVKVRGASVYTLSEKASDKEAEALAARENSSDIIAGVDLKNYDKDVQLILIDKAQDHSKQESVYFAQYLIENLKNSIRVLKNPHRFAGFAVLKSPNVPSVLVELGYLSNRQDEQLLKTKNFRIKVSKAILNAINAYFSRIEKVNKS